LWVKELELRGDDNSIAVPGWRCRALRAVKIRKWFQRDGSNLPLAEWIGRRTRETQASSVEQMFWSHLRTVSRSLRDLTHASFTEPPESSRSNDNPAERVRQALKRHSDSPFWIS